MDLQQSFREAEELAPAAHQGIDSLVQNMPLSAAEQTPRFRTYRYEFQQRVLRLGAAGRKETVIYCVFPGALAVRTATGLMG